MLVARWLAVRQARVRISARHPMEVPPTEPTAVKLWRWDSANVYEWMVYECIYCIKKNKCKKSGIRPPNLYNYSVSWLVSDVAKRYEYDRIWIHDTGLKTCRAVRSLTMAVNVGGINSVKKSYNIPQCVYISSQFSSCKGFLHLAFNFVTLFSKNIYT